jgi:hypothetical protein
MLYTCDLCAFSSTKLGNFTKHLETSKHIHNVTLEQKQKIMLCAHCKQYETSDKSNFKRHTTSCAVRVEKRNTPLRCKRCHIYETNRVNNLTRHELTCKYVPKATNAENTQDSLSSQLLIKLTEVQQAQQALLMEIKRTQQSSIMAQ